MGAIINFMNYWRIILLILVIIVFFVSRVYNLNNTFVIFGDSARDLLKLLTLFERKLTPYALMFPPVVQFISFNIV